jgi:Cu(I)/Ag(I) efflux system membrane fusion protein
MRSHILRKLRLATIAVVVIPAALAASLAACSARESGEAGTNAAAAQAGPFTCPMHPSYVSNQPGDCPICNMKLVPIASLGGPSAGNSIPGRAAVSIPSDLQGRIGLRTVAIVREPFSRTIRAVARIEANERGLSIVSLRTGGWIEELFVQATGDLVRPGDPLLSVYSPELFEAQQSYLLARASLGVEDEAVLGLRERLLLLDLTSDQVTALEARGAAEPRTTLLA